jgi:hypothetical protein
VLVDDFAKLREDVRAKRWQDVQILTKEPREKAVAD